MGVKKLIEVMAYYHKWAYEVLFRTVDQLKENDYYRSNGLVFKSIHGTLNHLYLGDQVWYCRFSDKPHAFKSLTDISFKDYELGKKMILLSCDEWIDFINGLHSQLPETITVTNFRGIRKIMPYLPTLLHVFNHATHHRGQISASITQLGLPAPEMDLIYYLRQ